MFLTDCDGCLTDGGMYYSENGEESMCGWLKDQYGFSWQITPKRLIELTNTDNPEKNKKAFDAMLKMKKIIIQDIEDAANS